MSVSGTSPCERESEDGLVNSVVHGRNASGGEGPYYVNMCGLPLHSA